MSTFYRISDFARLAGITVRTLQYYDRIDLLKPSAVTDGQHRLYQRSDLLRLQQILTLKWMGFKLDQIKELLDNPQYDLQTALRLQKAAIDSQISNLQSASEALAKALSVDSSDIDMLDNDGINRVIHAVMLPQPEWIRDAFTDEAWAGIASRRIQYTDADFEQFAQDWRDLIQQFETVRHLPLASEAVQALAAIMDDYIRLFSAGDRDAESGVATVWQNRQQMPPDYKMADDDLMRFIQQAYDIYRKTKET
ncbi:MAG: MerR family transcriptional regulator [Phototrophicaceae bacterium]